MNELILFENQNVKLEVNMKEETVWLNAEQMAKLFDRDYKTIKKHINNALSEELDSTTVAKFATVQKEGNRIVNRKIDYYNLDMIISIGYRVKSKNGIIFRKWANQILKEYLLKGYAVNQKRLEYLEKKIKLIDIGTRAIGRISDEATNILNTINKFSKGLDLLDSYDHKTFNKKGKTKSSEIITYQNCKDLIELLKYNENSEIFALERNRGLESIINNIYQSFGGEDLYKTIEEKAANFLYLTVKDHAFIDGNKRIAATLFIYFLYFYNILDFELINNNTLAALTILIAESNPKEKEIIVDLIMNFLNYD